MKQQPDRPCEQKKSKQKQNQFTTRSIVRFSPQIMQLYH